MSLANVKKGGIMKYILIILIVLTVISAIEITMYKKKVKQDEKDIEEAMEKISGR